MYEDIINIKTLSIELRNPHEINVFIKGKNHTFKGIDNRIVDK